MRSTTFPLDAYCNRIGYSGPADPTDAVLEMVQRAQLAAIPFENFDILLGRGVSLEPEALCQKLIGRRRGGYCFELNGLFLAALQAMGFDARALLARVHLSGQPTGRGHQLVLVRVGSRRWVADVGFGGPSLRAPIPMELDEPRTQDGQRYRLVDAGPFGTMLQAESEGRWRDLYSFDLEYVCPADIVVGNHFTSTHPSSFFTFARVAALHTPMGRIALLNSTVRRIENGVETHQELPAGPGFIEALETLFGIDLAVPYDALPPLPPAEQRNP